MSHPRTASPANGREGPLRASDEEREQAAMALRDHSAAGRLTVEELAHRVQAAFAARTRQDLRALLEDLPERPEPGAADRGQAKARAYIAHVRAYLIVSLGLVAIWAVSGLGYFWPVWPILGWGVGVASHTAGWCAARPSGKRLGTPSGRRSLPRSG